MTVDDAAFRAALGRFASGVTVVSTNDAGVDHALTASAFTSVSLRPPQVLMCPSRTTRFHDPAVASGRWAVSILADRGRECSAWFAHTGRPLIGQFDHVPHHRSPSGLVLIDAALAWMECRTVAVHDGGDHSILVGAVEWAAVAEGVEDDPLLYYRSHYGTIVRSPESEKTLQAGDGV
jgi:flavin reductase (DIM6/NTAB) family NADH-FMN oxidoreductase RutF